MIGGLVKEKDAERGGNQAKERRLGIAGRMIQMETLRRGLSDWLTDMALVPAGTLAEKDGYIGYERPYATSHQDLDDDTAFRLALQGALARTGIESYDPSGERFDPTS